MPVQERARLAAILRDRRIPMIEDVVYNDLASESEHRQVVRSFDAQDWVFLCGSYSKTIAPGLRVGWLAAPQAWGRSICQLKTAIAGGQSLVDELAMAHLLVESSYVRQLRRLRELNARQLDDARRIVSESFPPGVRVTDPAGGSIIWVEFPHKIDVVELFMSCLDEGILIAPGTMFSASDAYRRCMRLCVPRHPGNEYRQALRRIGDLAKAALNLGEAERSL